MENRVKDIDARSFYLNALDPDAIFNRIEITLSHLFREETPILNGQTYSDCVYQYLERKGYLRSQILEIGGGLGDLAYNLLRPNKNYNSKIEQYTLYDISPTLLQTQRVRLQKSVSEYILSDCLNLSAEIPSFSGMILSNGMVADLRSIYISEEDSLSSYGVQDKDLEDFLAEWKDVTGGWYFHIGTLLFLRQVSIVLKPAGTAVIAEYAATTQNQPSLFENHYECGIDFIQIAAYARRLGFNVELVDVEDILGISRDQQFLTIDVFTRQDRLAREIPASVKLWKANNPLPVLAYTRQTFREVLMSDYLGLSRVDATALAEALDEKFHSIHDPRFDRTNPTTWGYKFLLLEKCSIDDWTSLANPFAVPVIADVLGVSQHDAENRWGNWCREPKMGLETVIIEAIIGGICYDLLNKFGRIVWTHFIEEHVASYLENKNVSEGFKKKIVLAIRKVVATKRESERI